MTTLDINEIVKYLPHRYPFLLVDRVIELEEGKRVVAIKNVTINEPFFPGHFPNHPVMPGVLIVEAMAQAAAVLSFKTMGVMPDENSLVLFAGIDNVRFKRPVTPGDQLVMEVEIVNSKRNIYKYHGVARVDGLVAAEADLMCALKTKS
ncbi:3-hydroxyacyl-ACP dehydratase FabZ [Denitromonas ohlonensis]|uniref:3-hydroxyacyl-[acyl-carrier-protein] dehydratase FabZ n=2 Tax=Denitromonas TaxID=139331 RepID=A0A558EI63_9RHOO|nr:3-hydroxyacyl-ACP dehydratase FabZ [Denitromonas ohlonensis]TVT48505.1 MAG: 3-hydroxyacyl-ACP dehydratase FabZ [Denitromonas halophila]TVO69419.1 3-hydroxyacyl-ACP dehydratase FabZ [Denitromonas ohlonensis]TVO77519.1 3-hydroxyacyl-ACP dehydratase FabZ [Denitromonas ohlonensis]TVT73086.1 MAG: 3-hydroxyacyl-ACP dehydratase FabZ [Denitromonas halophila]TVT74140.1 MAG: 3-hydroxyacyl-ACP dehydratase FabZ [Denitromonas halophila]